MNATFQLPIKVLILAAIFVFTYARSAVAGIDDEPVITTMLTEDYDLEMAELDPYRIVIHAAIDTPSVVDSVLVDINGYTGKALLNATGYYYCDWVPSAYGDHEISMTAYASNGSSSNIYGTVKVVQTASDQTVRTMDAVDITFGGENSRWYYGTYTMPQHVGVYDSIVAKLTIGCPGGNCDDWDRWAHIDVKDPEGNWIQIIRYITPYGVGCDHSVDLTQYATLLQGELEFRVFIDTWGTGGWLVTLDFEMYAGTPQYKYIQVDEVWDGSYDFGNPSNLQPVEIINFTHHENTQKAELLISNTGHGWGANNSQNAAEFYHGTNYIYINDFERYTEDLWRICDPNPDGCSPQGGTWYHDRAGWCPGAISPANKYNLTYTINLESFELQYKFDTTYQDYCHSANPNCVSGITCTDCNDGYNPVYYVDGQMISYSNTLFGFDPTHIPVDTSTTDTTTTGLFIDNVLEYDLKILPNPVSGQFSLVAYGLSGNSRVTIQTVSGQMLRTYYFRSKAELENYRFHLEGVVPGQYFICLENSGGMGVESILIL